MLHRNSRHLSVRGFSLSSFAIVAVMAAIASSLAYTTFMKQRILNRNSEMIAMQVESIATGLSRYYKTTCNTGSVDLSDLNGLFMGTIVPPRHIKSYSMEIAIRNSQPIAIVNAQMQNLDAIDAIANVPVANGAKVVADTIIYERSVYFDSDLQRVRLAHDASFFTSLSC